jgi:hypothetical protein
MLNFVYNSQDPNKIVPVVEETLRKELRLSVQVPCQVIPTGENGVSARSLILDSLNVITTIYFLQFTVPGPRPFQLQVKIDREGRGALLGSLTYCANLAKPVAGEVSLEPPKIFGASKFVGNDQTASRLNGNKALIKKANQLTQTESELGQYKFKIERYLKITPQESYPLLTVHSLPRKTGLVGLNSTLNSNDFVQLVSLMEPTL